MKTETLPAGPLKQAAPPHRGYVLVVDDEEHNRDMLRDSLEVLGYEIGEAADGKQALQSVAARQPDVILLDVMMPGLDGFEICQRLKNDSRTSAIPILMVTALSDREERMAGVAAGASDFLTKPLDIQDLTLRVRNAVQLRHLYAQVQHERDRADCLLYDILPPAIAVRMKQGETNIADYHPEVTVMMLDLVGFTSLCAHIGAAQVVDLLNEIFSAFDECVSRRGLEKIKTIGDGYMVAGGLAIRRSDHTEAIARLAFDLAEEVVRLNRDYHTSICVRTGISTGPVIGGVIGRKKLNYDLWGATVNQACRLETFAESGTILVSEGAYERLKGRYRFTCKDKVQIPGMEAQSVYQMLGPT
jgi:adenylate cyclase